MANPTKSTMLSSLPDETVGEMGCMQQGDKWKTHKMFQNPMVTLDNGRGIGVGDLLEISVPMFNVKYFLVNRFFKQKMSIPLATPNDVSASTEQNYVVYAEGYLVMDPLFLAVSRCRCRVPLIELNTSRTIPKNSFASTNNGLRRFDVSEVGQFLNVQPSLCDDNEHVFNLWNNQGFCERWKRNKPDVDLMKVVVTPLMLFTDDTSGNLSKQYNLFDSYLMIPAAMSYDARSSKNNCFFVCTSNKKLSAVNMLSPLVEDLKQLEKGVQMNSIVHKQTVLVVAPLLLIQADNYRHSELSMHKGSVAGCFCRKCKIRNRKNPNPKPRKNATAERRADLMLALEDPTLLPPVEHRYPLRTIDDLILLRDTDDEEDGFTVNGSEQLLLLESYNPTLDTPIKLLHTLPLGIGKTLVQFLLKTSLPKAEVDLFQNALSDYRKCQAYSRNFRALLNHNGSFHGRDFKQLTQIIPVILRQTFPDCAERDIIDLTAKCFDVYSCLYSMAYMRNFTGDKDAFIKMIDHFADKLIKCTLHLDNFCIETKKTPTCLLSLQPKLHTLRHMASGIHRFGMSINYETEHGEQFNKFIREEILRTNRHNPSKDVSIAFARQFIIHHVVSGGSFLVNYKNPVSKLLFDSRENANNDYREASRMTATTAGLFEYKTPSETMDFFGAIVRINRGKYIIQKYVIEPYSITLYSRFFNRYRSPVFEDFLTTVDNNIVMKPIGEETEYDLEDIMLKQRLDMHSTYNFGNLGQRRLLNIHKFGSLWSNLRISNQ
ncbi:hypothetical protein BD770DRAFT_455737 [Pilaira anomala]|nr:hypothetical protein BD770DRAFT_455737 [Pilaira anomala]